ncbi:hypothetical protein PENTCL1PPCAC_28506, partial [Pristionchus entomophagus]
QKMYDDFLESPTIIPPSNTIQLGVSTTKIKDDDAIIEERFGRIVEEAATISRSLKYGLDREEAVTPSPSVSSLISSSLPLVAKLIKRESTGKRTILHFLVEMDGRIVQAEAIVKDISLLSMPELSAIIHYPVSSISTTSMEVVEESATWWKIGLIIGGGLLLLFIGWCCLFVYFNTCGRVSLRDRKKEELYEDRTVQTMESNSEEKTERKKEEERRENREERLERNAERKYHLVRRGR